jgi:hypothetical protein
VGKQQIWMSGERDWLIRGGKRNFRWISGRLAVSFAGDSSWMNELTPRLGTLYMCACGMHPYDLPCHLDMPLVHVPVPDNGRNKRRKITHSGIGSSPQAQNANGFSQRAKSELGVRMGRDSEVEAQRPSDIAMQDDPDEDSPRGYLSQAWTFKVSVCPYPVLECALTAVTLNASRYFMISSLKTDVRQTIAITHWMPRDHWSNYSTESE